MIVQGVCNLFKLDLLQFMAKDVFRMALYTSDAMLDVGTEYYTTEGEVANSPGYSAGGIVLRGFFAELVGKVALLSWSNPVWENSQITARAGLIYNHSRNNVAVAVVDLGKDYTSTNGSFTVRLPEAKPQTALIRVN
jgi:hypothetical protein